MTNTHGTVPTVPLPSHWSAAAKSAMLRGIGLAQFALAYTRGWAANSRNARVRLKAQLDRAQQEISLLREEVRIKNARMARIPPPQRPHYPPTERMAILELKAARAWSLQQTAKAFSVTAATIASWLARLDEEGPDALVQVRQPINRFPDFVRCLVQRLKVLCPMMGKAKIAQVLARAGLHLGTTTVERIVHQNRRPTLPINDSETTYKQRVVAAKCPGHVWHVDLTLVPTGAGFWASWLPFALPQCWPFCYWVAIVVDHFSRRVMGATAFDSQPTSQTVRAFLGRTIAEAKKPPRHIVCDRGRQFDCDGFRKWCNRKGIKPRYGAIGKHGSIAVVERFILTMKCLLGCLLLVPYRRESFQRELDLIVDWYNERRPHEWLGGRTPNEVYYGRFPANRSPRFETRPNWPRGSPCAKPWALVRGSPGATLKLEVTFHRGRKHLPIVRLKRAA
jgi:transposase InsO family protein